MTVDPDTPAGRAVIVDVARRLAAGYDPELVEELPLDLADFIRRGWLELIVEDTGVRLVWSDGGEHLVAGRGSDVGALPATP